MLATALSVQLGGAVAATLIPQVGPMGTVALRITIATLIIAPIALLGRRGYLAAYSALSLLLLGWLIAAAGAAPLRARARAAGVSLNTLLVAL